MGKVVLINISIKCETTNTNDEMNDVDWQLGIVTFVGGFNFQEKKRKRRQHPPFFSQINILPQTFESRNKGQKRKLHSSCS